MANHDVVLALDFVELCANAIRFVTNDLKTRLHNILLLGDDIGTVEGYFATLSCVLASDETGSILT